MVIWKSLDDLVDCYLEHTINLNFPKFTKTPISNGPFVRTGLMIKV